MLVDLVRSVVAAMAAIRNFLIACKNIGTIFLRYLRNMFIGEYHESRGFGSNAHMSISTATVRFSVDGGSGFSAISNGFGGIPSAGFSAAKGSDEGQHRYL